MADTRGVRLCSEAMTAHTENPGGLRPSQGRRSRNWRSRSVAVLSVLGALGAAGTVATVQSPEAHAIICVGIGRVIGISDCFGGGYAMHNHMPPPSDYAPLPQDYAPAPAATTTTPPPAP